MAVGPVGRGRGGALGSRWLPLGGAVLGLPAVCHGDAGAGSLLMAASAGSKRTKVRAYCPCVCVCVCVCACIYLWLIEEPKQQLDKVLLLSLSEVTCHWTRHLRFSFIQVCVCV